MLEHSVFQETITSSWRCDDCTRTVVVLVTIIQASATFDSYPKEEVDSQMQTIMENDCGEVLGEIIRKLAPLFEKRSTFRREVLSAISEISMRITDSPPTPDEFAVFCIEIHDWLVKFDSPLRAMLLRVLRLSINSPGNRCYYSYH